MDPVYYLKNIRQYYSGRLVLSIDSLRINRCEILGIHGPNGSGKSTLLRLLALLEEPSQGKVYFNDHLVHPQDLTSRRKVTILFQSPYLLRRSVLSNVTYGLKIRKIRNRRERALSALQDVGLDRGFARRMWFELSGGEAQRVALASRLVLSPEILLLDEPTAYLDRESTELIRSASLKANNKYNTTIVLVSHDLEWLHSICGTVLYIRNGELIDNS